MTKNNKYYKIPDEYFFRIHHVRPRFKNDVEEVLLYVATSISELGIMNKTDFNSELNKVLFGFKNNQTATKKTIDNWRTEISALFSFIQSKGEFLIPGKTAIRLANNQYLDEFFNYFLYTFQYPGGHIKPHNILKVVDANVRFKPCKFILELLLAGEKLTGKPFSINSEELTQCAFFDLRVTRDGMDPKLVAQLILSNRKDQIKYDHKYDQLKNPNTGDYPSKGDLCRYAGDILDYMVLANLLEHKGTGYYYYLNSNNLSTINFHVQNSCWFDGYDKFYGRNNVTNDEIFKVEELWHSFVNSFDEITDFVPRLDNVEQMAISDLIEEYYLQLSINRKVPTKIIGDYGETLILAHEYLRTKNLSNRQHLINKIPTQYGVGYDIQSIELKSKKRYIEVKTTKSKKVINNYRFKLTPNEWDTAETLGDCYYIYYLVVNDHEKNIFIINNPINQLLQGNIKVDKNFVVEFTKKSGQWEKLMEIRK